MEKRAFFFFFKHKVKAKQHILPKAFTNKARPKQTHIPCRIRIILRCIYLARSRLSISKEKKKGEKRVKKKKREKKRKKACKPRA